MIIDITNEILTKLKNDLDVDVYTSYPQKTPKFPCVTFEELANISVFDTIDSGGEHYNDIAFEVNIFSSSQPRLTKIREIRNAVDAILSDHYGLNRDFSGTTPNFVDQNIYRYTLRYSGIISESKVIHRR